MDATVDFFLGSRSQAGYTSLFSEMTKPPLISLLLTGPSGRGKANLLSVAEEYRQKDGFVERFRCGCHPGHLDGLYFHDSGLSLLSSQEPHTWNPKYPLAYETEISVNHCYDTKPLSFYRERIAALTTAQEDSFGRCGNYLQGTRAFLKDNFLIALEMTNTEKIAHMVRRISHQEFAHHKGSRRGIEHRRFLGAVTPNGVTTCWETVERLCQRVYLVHDEFGCASRILMAALRAVALEAGEEIFTCYCPLQPFEKIDHILFPQASIGFVTENKLLKPQLTPYRRIHCTRFMNLDQLDEKKERLKFNRKAAADMLAQATGCMRQASDFHRQICEIYEDAEKKEAFDAVAGELLERLDAAGVGSF